MLQKTSHAKALVKYITYLIVHAQATVYVISLETQCENNKNQNKLSLTSWQCQSKYNFHQNLFWISLKYGYIFDIARQKQSKQFHRSMKKKKASLWHVSLCLPKETDQTTSTNLSHCLWRMMSEENMKNEVGWTEKAEFLAVGKACKTIFCRKTLKSSAIEWRGRGD